MKKILAIGNSFSEDATTYLHDIASEDGVKSKIVNLYIGGCSLETHCENLIADDKAYRLDVNGVPTDSFVSIKEILKQEEFDIVTIQQASHFSGFEETYYPYIEVISNTVKELLPNATQMIHQTWAYEIDSDHSAFVNYNKSQDLMHKRLKLAYQNVSDNLGLEIIPCGDLIQDLRKLKEFDYENGGISLCRDGFHMNMIYGRYATAMLWYQKIFKANVLENAYLPPEINGEKCDFNIIKKIKELIYTKY